MKKWIMKAIIQKTISYLPFSNNINYLFQKFVTKGVYLTDEYFYDRLEHAKVHLNSYKKYSGKNIPDVTLEIGTGWYPVVPVAFFLSGTKKTYSVDISFLTSKERIRTTLEMYIVSEKEKKLTTYINILPERFSVLEEILKNINSLSLQQILEKLNIVYLIDDAGKLDLPDQSIDLINSNNTFEHIYPTFLIPILKEFKRVVKRNHGIMSHFIDMSDHFAHFDKTINIYNFLRFSDKQWKLIDNSIQPQSRLRIYDYRKIYSDLNIPINEESFREGNIIELQSIKTDEKYRNHPLNETAKSHCHFVSVLV